MNLQNRGDIAANGGKVFSVGEFCGWSTTNPNAIELTQTGSGTKIWEGSVSLYYGSLFTYKVRLNNDEGTWDDNNNWYPNDNQTFRPTWGYTSISLVW